MTPDEAIFYLKTLLMVRPAWLEEIRFVDGALIVSVSDPDAARHALGGRMDVDGWPIEIRRVTPR